MSFDIEKGGQIREVDFY